MPTPDTARQTPAPEALARQLRLFKLLAGLLAAALVLGTGAFLLIRHLGQPVTILVDGKPVATVRNAAAANGLLEQAEKSQVGPAFAGEELVRMQKVRLTRAPADVPQDPDGVALAKLRRRLTLHVHAFVILVRGRPSVALPSADEATSTLRRVKDHWAGLPPAAPLLGSPEIMETVEVQRRAVDTGLTRADARTAAPYFWTPPHSKSYTVRRGDIASRIASHSHLSLADLITANPNKSMSRLQPGDVLNVQKMPLLLTVRVRKTLERTEKVNPTAQAAQAGQQRVTYAVTYINGQETRREAQSVVVLEKPQTALSL